jgi:hypothetical protein
MKWIFQTRLDTRRLFSTASLACDADTVFLFCMVDDVHDLSPASKPVRSHSCRSEWVVQAGTVRLKVRGRTLLAEELHHSLRWSMLHRTCLKA